MNELVILPKCYFPPLVFVLVTLSINLPITQYSPYVQVMQTSFFGLCVVTDIAHMAVSSKAARSGLPSRLLRTRDYIFTVLALPVGTVSVSKIYDDGCNLSELYRNAKSVLLK